MDSAKENKVVVAESDGELKISRYNFLVERDDGVVGYNARKGSFAKLSQAAVLALRGEQPISDLSEIDSLRTLGFVHRGDELKLISDRYESSRDQDTLFLTFVPTISCNFACDYCFQNGDRNKRIWSSEMRDDVKSFVRYLLKQGPRDVRCTWFGGEPLLAKDIVIEDARVIKEMIKEEGSNLLNMDIITNATLLDENTAISLSDAGIDEAQISIDSWEFVKPHRRGAVMPSGEPSIIIKNAVAASKYLNVYVRVNIGKSLDGEVEKVVDYLEANGFAGQYAFARVDNYDEDRIAEPIPTTNNSPSCGGWRQTNKTIPRTDYAKVERESYERGSSYLNVMKAKLKPKTAACAATSGNMFVIDADGYVSRCWASAGKSEEAEAHVKEFRGLNIGREELDSRWLSFTPLAYPECKTCKVLPLCMGGCSYPRVFREAASPPCEAIKKQVSKFVDELGSRLQLPESQ
jgi:uncharacterized protein